MVGDGQLLSIKLKVATDDIEIAPMKTCPMSILYLIVRRQSYANQDQDQININHLQSYPLPCHLHIDCKPTIETYKTLVSTWMP